MEVLENKIQYICADDIYKVLKKEILTLKIMPGEKVSENVLGKRFNVSRTPIRNVLQRLKSEGLLEIMPKSGSFISLINLDIAEQIIYMRIQTELAVFKYIANHPNSFLFGKIRSKFGTTKKIIRIKS